MISLLDKQQIILKHYRDGMPIRAIQRETGIARKTIRKYVNDYENKRNELLNSDNDESKRLELTESIVEKPAYDSSNRQKIKLTPEVIYKIKYFLEENAQRRATGRSKQQRKKCDIHEELVQEGFDLGYTTVCNAIRNLEKRYKEAFIKQKYNPGEVCEFDWGEVKLIIGGKRFTLQMAAFTSALGNYRYVLLSYNQKTESFLEAHADFFEHIKGVYYLLVYDNTRVVVKKFVGPSEKEPTEALLKLSLYYGFNFRFCNACAGWEKGHVEKTVEYVRRKAFSSRDEFSSLSEAQEYLNQVCKRLNQKKQPYSENKSAQDILEEEKKHLLPRVPKYDAARIENLRVDKYSTVCIDTCRYSVPDIHVGEMLMVKVYNSHILCYYEREKIAEHERKHGPHEWSIVIGHYLRTLKKKPGALKGSLALHQAPELQKLYQLYFTGKEKEFIHLLQLIGEKGWTKVEKAIETLRKITPCDISAEKIKTLCNRSEDNKTVNYGRDTETRSKDTLRAYGKILSPEGNTFEKGARVL